MAKIVLDPGHGKGTNKGTVSGYYEGTAMYHYANRLAKKLKSAGIDVEITRGKVTDDPSLTARGKTANGADMFVSLHSNAASASSAQGVTVFYSIKRDDDKVHAAKLSKELASLINGGTRDRGACTRKGGGDWDYYTVIQYAVKVNCPHVFLIEHGFHSNANECAWLMDEDNLEAMANLECKLFCEILGVKGTVTETPKEESDPVILCTMRVNTPNDTLNLRKSSNYKSAKLGELAHGSKVDVYKKATNGWWYVQQGKLAGWVNSDYLVAVNDKPELTRILKLTTPNMEGEDIRWVQNRLKNLGYTAVGTVDGIFGPKTDKAVKQFQKDNNLVQDGDVGVLTYGKL